MAKGTAKRARRRGRPAKRGRPTKRRERQSKEKGLKCFGYARVSTVKQVETPGGIKAQVQKIKRFCQMQGYQLIKIFKDEGVSAIDERPAFNKMMEAISKKEADAVAVTRLDRLGRDRSLILSRRSPSSSAVTASSLLWIRILIRRLLKVVCYLTSSQPLLSLRGRSSRRGCPLEG